MKGEGGAEPDMWIHCWNTHTHTQRSASLCCAITFPVSLQRSPTSLITAFHYLDYSTRRGWERQTLSFDRGGQDSVNWRASVLTPFKETRKSVCVCVCTCRLCSICMNLDAPHVPFDPIENKAGDYFNPLLCRDTWQNKPKAGCGGGADYCKRTTARCTSSPPSRHIKAISCSRYRPFSLSEILLDLLHGDWQEAIRTDIRSQTWKKGGLNTEGLGETSGGWVGLRMLYTRFISLGGVRSPGLSQRFPFKLPLLETWCLFDLCLGES